MEDGKGSTGLADGSAAEGTASGSDDGSGIVLGGAMGVCSLATGSVGFNQGRAGCSEGVTSSSMGSELIVSGVEGSRAAEFLSTGVVSGSAMSGRAMSCGTMSGGIVSRGSEGSGGVSGPALVKS